MERTRPYNPTIELVGTLVCANTPQENISPPCRLVGSHYWRKITFVVGTGHRLLVIVNRVIPFANTWIFASKAYRH